jgi:PPOX class probable F420-dependent enzyme
LVDIPASHRALLVAPVGVLATIGPEELPQATAVWFLWDEAAGTLLFSLNTVRQKVKNLQARPRASFLILDPANPYRTLELRGAVDIQPDDDYLVADRLGAKYGSDLRSMDQAGGKRVVVTLHPTRLATWGE